MSEQALEEVELVEQGPAVGNNLALAGGEADSGPSEQAIPISEDNPQTTSQGEPRVEDTADSDKVPATQFSWRNSVALLVGLFLLLVLLGLSATTTSHILDLSHSQNDGDGSCLSPEASAALVERFASVQGGKSPVFTSGVSPKIVIAYHSVSGGTKQVANWTAGGALACCNATVLMVDVGRLQLWNDPNATFALLSEADGLILGSGVYNGNTHYEMQQWITSWPNVHSGGTMLDLSWTVGDAFCTSGGWNSGSQPTLFSLQRGLQTFNALYAGGTSWRTQTGVCGIVTGSNGAEGMQDVGRVARNAQYMGYRVAMLASQIKAAKILVRSENEDPFDYNDPSRLTPDWPPRIVTVTGP